MRTLWCFVSQRGHRSHFTAEKLSSFLSVKVLQSGEAIERSWGPVYCHSRSRGRGPVFLFSTFIFFILRSQLPCRDIWTEQIHLLNKGKLNHQAAHFTLRTDFSFSPLIGGTLVTWSRVQSLLIQLKVDVNYQRTNESENQFDRHRAQKKVVMKVKPISLGDRVQTKLSWVQLTVTYFTVIRGSIDIDSREKSRRTTLVRIIEVTWVNTRLNVTLGGK